MSAAAAHITFERLVEYWLGELDEATTEALDAHLLGCEVCGAELDAVIALAGGVRGAFVDGHVAGFVSADFIEGLTARDVRVREYRVERDGAVNCTVAPEDDVLVSRLQAQLEGVERVDVELQHSLQDRPLRLEDVPFDARRGEVLMVPKLTEVRQLPASVLRVRLLAVRVDGVREIGHYTLNHRPWA